MAPIAQKRENLQKTLSPKKLETSQLENISKIVWKKACKSE
jgi:hypothetical protein